MNSLKEANILVHWRSPWTRVADLTGAHSSCVLMYKQELLLMYPDDEQVKKVQAAFYDL